MYVPESSVLLRVEKATCDLYWLKPGLIVITELILTRSLSPTILVCELSPNEQYTLISAYSTALWYQPIYNNCDYPYPQPCLFSRFTPTNITTIKITTNTNNKTTYYQATTTAIKITTTTAPYTTPITTLFPTIVSTCFPTTHNRLFSLVPGHINIKRSINVRINTDITC